jgi:hypothetical protein
VTPPTPVEPPADDPPAPGALIGPVSTWETEGTVADPHTQGTCMADPRALSVPPPASPLTPVRDAAGGAVCPFVYIDHTITLDASNKQPLHYLDVTLAMDELAPGRGVEDYDLVLLHADGSPIMIVAEDGSVSQDASSSSGHAIGTVERISMNNIPDGTYIIRVTPYTNAPDSHYKLSVLYRTSAI